MVKITELEICHNKIEMVIISILDEKINEKEVCSVVFGPNTELGEEENPIFFRVIYEDSIVTPIGKTYKISQPIRITSNVDNIDTEYAKQESIRLNSWVADRIFKDKEFKSVGIVNDVILTNVLTAYPLEKDKPSQLSSGIRILVDFNLDFQCEKI